MSESKLMPEMERLLRDPAQAFNYASTYAIDLLLSEIDALREKLSAAARPWMCDACAGMGDDLGCMCGGSGLAVDAVDYLREQLFKRIATTSQGQASRLALRALDALSTDKKEPADD